MKSSKFLFLFLLIFNTAFSQKEVDSTISFLNNYRWRIDVGVGESRGIRPFTEGYFSSNSQKKFGFLDINSITFGANYTHSKLLGFKFDFAFDRLKNKDVKSTGFEVAQFRATVQGVVDFNNILKYQNENSRFKILFHSGLSVATLQQISSSEDPYIGSRELNGGIVVGATPMYRFSRKAYIFFDFSSFYNFRQHYTWDGSYSRPSNNLSGQMINGTLGISYSFGKQLKWNMFEEEELKKLKVENEELEKRVGSLETMMNDSDKDGVADYLDSENNSVAGVAVDSRGVMVDSNKNGVPDELERYFEKTYGSTKNGLDGNTKSVASSDNDFLQRSINEGYITVFFESNSTKPNTKSTNGIHFILTYLKAYPEASIDIIGFSDEIGDSVNNTKLALARATNVKNTLIKSGINESRLNVISAGEDNSVDPNSAEARKLVRKVVFRIR